MRAWPSPISVNPLVSGRDGELVQVRIATAPRLLEELLECLAVLSFPINPQIYHGVVRSVASQTGRDVARNARLFAAVSQAMDDSLIGVFDAKYHYNFWRPATAIRNGDIDGNDATQRDASWSPLVDAPMHPEYPSGHAILAGAVGAVLKADVGDARTATLATASPTAKGATRRWTSVDDFVREVGDSRIYAGIHYRAAIDAGVAMGKQIGELAAEKVLQTPH